MNLNVQSPNFSDTNAHARSQQKEKKKKEKETRNTKKERGSTQKQKPLYSISRRSLSCIMPYPLIIVKTTCILNTCTQVISKCRKDYVYKTNTRE